MIALPAALPLIRIGADSLALCKTEWLTETLADATNGTNIPDWLATDICKGIEHYLANHYTGTTIDSAELFRQIRITLEKVGLNDVAENLNETVPPVRISLSDLARRAGNGYELAFFHLLETQFRSATNGGAQTLECYGLEKCVKQLSASKMWSTACESLKEEITGFLDMELARSAHHMPALSMHVYH